MPSGLPLRQVYITEFGTRLVKSLTGVHYGGLRVVRLELKWYLSSEKAFPLVELLGEQLARLPELSSLEIYFANLDVLPVRGCTWKLPALTDLLLKSELQISPLYDPPIMCAPNLSNLICEFAEFA